MLASAQNADHAYHLEDWTNLKTLKSGQQIRIVMNDSKMYKGALQSLDDAGISVQQGTGVQTIAREKILRIYYRWNHDRLANIALGAGLGTFCALLIVIANKNLRHPWIYNTAWVWPAGMGVGAGIGAAVHVTGWHEVYRAPRHRPSATGEASPPAQK